MSQSAAAGSWRRELQDLLKERDIASFFSGSAFHKARAYAAERRVSALDVDSDLTRVTASVRGSNRVPYRVVIDLDFHGDRIADIDGDCTCPMGINCKHVAAVLLEAIREGRTPAWTGLPTSRRDDSGAAPAAPNLPYAVTDWLEKIDTTVRGDDYPADMTQRLVYCIEPSSEDAQTPVLSISLLSARVMKGGELGGSVTHPNWYEFAAERAPKYFRDCDIDIVSRLSSHFGRHAYGMEHRPVSIELLQQIVATGRAFWLDFERTPLRWGEARAGRIEWRQSGKRSVLPSLIVPGATALNAEPPVYVDDAAGLIGPVEVGLPPRLAFQLLSAPAVPQSQIAEFSRRLAQKLPAEHQGLLPAPPAAAVQINEDPAPVLRLSLGRAASYGYYQGDRSVQMPVARLGFRYGPIEIAASETGMRIEAYQGGAVHVVTRRRTAERAIRKRLTGFGFHPARSVFPGLDHSHRDDLTLTKPYEWLDFLHGRIAQLKAEGFQIHVDQEFPYRLVDTSGAVEADIESSGIDWFDLSLGIDIDGARYDLAPTLAGLVARSDFDPEAIRQLAADGDRFYLPLADGRHVRLTAGRFLPLILALHSLQLSEALSGKTGKIKLSRADVVPLLAIETEGFAIKGTESLRHLADLLRAQGLAAPRLPDTFRAELRPYQTQGVAWLDLLRESGLGGVLADDMGLGKTVQMLALLALEKARGHLNAPTLIVVPTSLISNWSNEARKFAPDLKILVLHGSDRKQKFASIADHDVVLSTYPLIARDRDVLLAQSWHVVVLDEAQTVKNPDAATTRWLRGIKAKHRFCMTGTPMENHLGELWSIMNFANPGYLGDKSEFARRWRTPIEKRADRNRASALAQRVKPFLLRRTKAEVAADLPVKSEIVERIELEGSQRDVYDTIRLSIVGQGSQGDRGARSGQKPHHRARSAPEDAAGMLRPRLVETRRQRGATIGKAGPPDRDGHGTPEREAEDHRLLAVYLHARADQAPVRRPGHPLQRPDRRNPGSEPCNP